MDHCKSKFVGKKFKYCRIFVFLPDDNLNLDPVYTVIGLYIFSDIQQHSVL